MEITSPLPSGTIPSAHRADKHEMAFEDSHPELFMSVKFLNILILLLALFLLKIILSPSLFIFFIQCYLSWEAWVEFHRFFKFMF